MPSSAAHQQNNSDTEEEEKRSSIKPILSINTEEKPFEKLDQEEVNKFLQSIQPALDAMQQTGKPLEYFKAKNLIITLASLVPEKTQQAVKNVYCSRLESSDHSVQELKKFITELEWLIIAANTTNVEREHLLDKILMCISKLETVEKESQQYIWCPKAKMYYLKLNKLTQSQFSVPNSDFDNLHGQIEDHLKKIETFFSMRQTLDRELQEMESKPCYTELVKLLDQEFERDVSVFQFSTTVFQSMESMLKSFPARKKAHLLQHYAEEFDGLPENSSAEELEKILDASQPGLVFVPQIAEEEEEFDLAASRESNLSPHSSVSPRSPRSPLAQMNVFARSLKTKYQATLLQPETPRTPRSPRSVMRSGSGTS